MEAVLADPCWNTDIALKRLR